MVRRPAHRVSGEVGEFMTDRELFIMLVGVVVGVLIMMPMVAI
jgi:hypothetical protein